MHIYMLLDHYAYVNDAYIHDPWDLTILLVCVMHISMMRQFCHGRTDGRTNGDPNMRVYDACIHDAAYLSCMYKPRLWCIYTLCMYVLCIYICSLIMYARCIYICSLIMMHMCMMHTSVIFNPWLCCMCVWCGWNFVTNQPTDKAILGVRRVIFTRAQKSFTRARDSRDNNFKSKSKEQLTHNNASLCTTSF